MATELANNSNIRLRVPPQSIEAEVGVLGSILIKPEVMPQVVEFLRPEDFYRKAHEKIYKAMVELFQKNEPVDILSVGEFLRSKGDLEDIGGLSYLAELSDSVAVASSASYYAKIVKDKAIRRRLIEKVTQIAENCFNEAEDVEELLEYAESVIFEISQAKVKQSFYQLNSVIKDSIKRVEELYKKKELITGVPTGFIDLDNITAGFQPSDLIIVAGRPSMGKTAFALNIAQHAAVDQGICVAIFSLEMSKEQLAIRMLCSEAQVNAQKLRTGFLSQKHDWPKIIRAANRLSHAPIFIDDTPAMSILEMRAKARRLKTEHNLGLIVVDYLQLMRGRDGSERREQEISEISRSLKAMAKELNVPVVALSQLNRKVEDRPNKRPQMADLRESGAIEQDADVIIFIYRDEVYNRSEDNPNKGIAEIIVAKQRNGPTGLVKLSFVSKYSSFGNIYKGPEEI